MSKGASKAVVDCLIKAMEERPDDFEPGSVTMLDKKTGYEYWVGNGRFFAGVHRPYSFKFGFIHGLRFWRALRGLKTHQLIQNTCGGKANATA